VDQPIPLFTIVHHEVSGMPESTLENLSQRIDALEMENRLLKRTLAIQNRGKAYFLAVFNNTPAPIFLKDTGFRYLLVNRQYECLAKTSRKQIGGKSDYDIFPREIAELFRSQDEAVLKRNRSLEFEETISLPDGDFSFITLKFPICDGRGKVVAIGGFCTDITERKRIEAQKEILILKLQTALEEVAALRGIFPICASCKKIRDDQGYWRQIEHYLKKHSNAEFSHSLCPECTEKLYGLDALLT
jgi:PAS domain S-box-containing protein